MPRVDIEAVGQALRLKFHDSGVTGDVDELAHPEHKNAPNGPLRATCPLPINGVWRHESSLRGLGPVPHHNRRA